MLQDFFIQNEVKLFSLRMQFLGLAEIQLMLQKASEQSKYILFGNNYVLKSYEKVLKSLIFVAEQLMHIIKENERVLKVPFTSGLKFIRERAYPLHLGYINLPLIELKPLLIHLFEELIFEGINQTRMSLCCKELDDPRMQYLSQKIKKWLHYELNPRQKHCKKITRGCNLMAESRKFPLCMNNLLNQLLKYHRLKHTSRVQFTLFLKEIGVSSYDAIQIFMKEYSKPLMLTHKDSHSHCSHNWDENKNRYIYSIEHLYGMRGACKNYRAHNCCSLQNFHDSEGGCPFVTFDDEHLQNALKNQNIEVNDIEDIMSLVQKKEYCKACSSYLLCKVTIHQRKKVISNQYNSWTMKSVTVGLDNFNIVTPNIISFLNKDNHHLLSSSLKVSSPSDFYSILSHYTDE